MIDIKTKKMKSESMVTRLLALSLIALGFLIPNLPAQAERTTTYYVSDALGSPIVAMDEQGEVQWRKSYLPYGKQGSVDPADDKDTAYTGKKLDRDTGLLYFGARWNDPDAGRFTGVDPVGFMESNPQSFNRYAYANNNPYRYIDPDGRVPIETVWDIANIGMGVASFGKNVAVGNYADATLDAIGVVADTAATFIPYMPGGAGTYIKAKRAKDTIQDVTKGEDNFVDGYRAVSKAEADDIAKHGFRPKPDGHSMQDKWFSESQAGAEKFKTMYPDLDQVVKAKVPKDVYDRSYKHSNIDNTGPGFCVACDDLSRLKVD